MRKRQKTGAKRTLGRKSVRASSRQRAAKAGPSRGPKKRAPRQEIEPKTFGTALSEARDRGDETPDMRDLIDAGVARKRKR